MSYGPCFKGTPSCAKKTLNFLATILIIWVTKKPYISYFNNKTNILLFEKINFHKSRTVYHGFRTRRLFVASIFTIPDVCFYPCSPKLQKQWMFWIVVMFTQDCWFFMANFSLLGQYLERKIVKMLPIPPKYAIPMKLPKATIVAQHCSAHFCLLLIGEQRS